MFICYFKGSESKDFNMACGERPVVNGTTFKNNGKNTLLKIPALVTHNSGPKKYLYP